MIVCSCNVIMRKDIEAVVIDLLDADEWRLITPGVVYHASYLRFMERGRSDFMRWTGIDHNDLMDAEGGLAFAVRRMIIEFAGSAGIDDVLTIETWMGDMRGASMLVKQRVLLEGRPIITADVKVALVTRAGKPRRMPLWLRKIFAPHAPEGAEVDGPE